MTPQNIYFPKFPSYVCMPPLLYIYSLRPKFQPNWSKYKFLPYLGILFKPKNTYTWKLPLQVTYITLVLVYMQNFSPIGVSTSSYHIWAYCLGPKIHIFENYLYRYMRHPCLSLRAKFQPNWSKYKFLPYLGILFGPKNTYIWKLPLQVTCVTLVLVYMQNFSPIGVSTSYYHIWAYCLGPKIHIGKLTLQLHASPLS